jgi:Protein of unknown function (DUF3093)
MPVNRERLYYERLRVPVSWWLVSASCVLILGTTLWAGFSVAIGLIVYLVMGGLLALALLTFGAVTVEVTATEVFAGRRRLPIEQITEVSPMDAGQTTALRGPRADVAAFLLIRPYLPESVYLAVAGQPYWLIGTRRPADLAAAVAEARSRADGSGRPGIPGSRPAVPGGRPPGPAPCDDDGPDDHAMQAGTGSSAQAAQRRKDGNAW